MVKESLEVRLMNGAHAGRTFSSRLSFCGSKKYRGLAALLVGGLVFINVSDEVLSRKHDIRDCQDSCTNPWYQQALEDLGDYTKITTEQIDAALKVEHAIHIVLKANRIYVRRANHTYLQRQIMQ